jgi:hypothetical protein
MFQIFTIAIGLGLVWCAGYYTDFIARDPHNPDKGPTWYGKLFGMLLLLGPFLLIPTDAYRDQAPLFNALLAIAVSSLVVPAIFANRTGDGLTWVLNSVEKALLTAVLAPIVSFLTVWVPFLYWFSVLVALGSFSMWSRQFVLYLAVQDQTKPDAWNEMRVRAMKIFYSRATWAYWALAFYLGTFVYHSGVGVLAGTEAFVCSGRLFSTRYTYDGARQYSEGSRLRPRKAWHQVEHLR